MKRRYVFGAMLTSAIVFADLYLKRLVASSFSLGESVDVVPGFFALTFILNPGAAFGLFSTWHSSIRAPLLLALSVGALGCIFYLYFGSLGKKKWPAIGLPLIAGGAMANLYERLTAGAVIDFLDFYISDYHWPAFNLADASIMTGVLLLSISSLLEQSSAESS